MIVVRGREPGGRRYLLNEFRGDNAAVSSAASEEDRARARGDLLARADRCATFWRCYFPRDAVEVRGE